MCRLFAVRDLFRALCAALCLALAAAMLAAASAPAQAQQRIERKSFLEFLFGGPDQQARPAPSRTPLRDRRSSRPRQQRPTDRATAPSPPPEPKAEKHENARRVLVIGDFLANGLADGLKESFETSPGVVIIGETNGSSGLVRDDYYNWRVELPAILEEHRPDVIVVQLGSNDSQQLRTPQGRIEVRSPEWLTEYERRTDELIRVAKSTGKPLVWVGLPSFNFASMSADMVALNAIFKAHVEQAGGEFVDIWDGFVDENGKFIFTGSDINGQQVRLRGSDGINMTRAGKRKMAFYAEKPIRRLLGRAADPGIGSAMLDGSNLPELNFPAAPLQSTNPVRTMPMAMTDPDLDGGSELLGGTIAPVNITPTPRDKLVGKGLAPDAPKGRVDNFAWPRENAVN